MNTLAEATAYYKVYNADGSQFYGETSFEFPELKKATVELKGSGIIGKIDAPIELALEPISASLNFRTLQQNMIKFLDAGKKSFTCVLLTQETDVATLAPVYKGWKVLLEGKSKSVELGKAEAGESSDSKCELEVYHIKIWQDGQEILDINKLGGVYKILGVDYMQAINQGLGNGTNVDLSFASNAQAAVLNQLQIGMTSPTTSLSAIVNSL